MKVLSFKPLFSINCLNAVENSVKNLTYSFELDLVSQPKMRFNSPSTFATIFGALFAPHCVNKCEISKYSMLQTDFSATKT